MKNWKILLAALLLASASVYAEGAKSYNNNDLSISVEKGDVYVPFKAGKGFWTFKVHVQNGNASEGRTLNGKLVLTSGGKEIGNCQVYVAVDAGGHEMKDVNCKHTAEAIDDFELKITKVYNKKM